MSTARDAVISSPELVELILARMPMRDLLVAAPRVSKTWNAITLTPTLQRILFFQPAPSHWAPMRNPLLMELLPPFFAPRGRVSWPVHTEIMAQMAFKRPDASWRRMLVVQPPAPALIVNEIHNADGGESRSQTTVNYDHPSFPGLRMGALYDLAVPLIKHPISSFYISWPGHDGVPCDEELTLMIWTRQYDPDWRARAPPWFHSGSLTRRSPLAR
ncbi:hypothetical protein B0H16DRAFT_1610305 [Mycena metata]|uniref:F-box domain-containing protein n=1 Tax=Mycena metata TaxID=1033252 RepID=A0AAD7HDB0_9AGAR|nr:hypothetical protein B0H16DRAFT_1610305 [Mycena metata]